MQQVRRLCSAASPSPSATPIGQASVMVVPLSCFADRIIFARRIGEEMVYFVMPVENGIDETFLDRAGFSSKYRAAK